MSAQAEFGTQPDLPYKTMVASGSLTSPPDTPYGPTHQSIFQTTLRRGFRSVFTAQREFRHL